MQTVFKTLNGLNSVAEGAGVFSLPRAFAKFILQKPPVPTVSSTIYIDNMVTERAVQFNRSIPSFFSSKHPYTSQKLTEVGR